MNAPINILFVSSYIDLGGGETALLNLVDNLDPHSWQWSGASGDGRFM